MKEFEIKEETRITCKLKCTVTTEIIDKTLVTLFEPENQAEAKK